MEDERLRRFIGELGADLTASLEKDVAESGLLESSSPIEVLMGVALLFVIRSHRYETGADNFMFHAAPPGVRFLRDPPRFESLPPERWRCGPPHWGFHITQQFPIGKYRADFFVDFLFWDRATHVMAVIECDGHDFHERTKEQAEHDKARDRYFQSLGLIVLRYTGAEIHRDPLGAAKAALSLLMDRAIQTRKATA